MGRHGADFPTDECLDERKTNISLNSHQPAGALLDPEAKQSNARIHSDFSEMSALLHY